MGSAACNRQATRSRFALNASSTPLETRIRTAYPSLSEHERRLADVILASPGRLAMHRAAELSEQARVSKATASRFFRALGYKDFEEARAQARKAADSGSPLYMSHPRVGTNSVGGLVERHMRNDLDNLVHTYRSLDLRTLPVIARKIAGAHRVVLLGYRHGYPVAAILRRLLVHIRPSVILLPIPGDTLAESLASLDSRDVAICVDLRRHVPQMHAAVQAMSELKVPVLYIGGIITGRAAKLATWVIRCRTGGIAIFDSAAAVVCVCNLLCTMVADQLSPANSEFLERIERLHARLDELE
jgi:DNA-binding MurR/RpiR family transcriptional regulator